MGSNPTPHTILTLLFKYSLALNYRMTKSESPETPKTQTIRQRTVQIYLPSLETLEDWKGKAKTGGISLSKFIIEHVGNSLQREWENGHGSRRDMQKRITDLEGKLSVAEDHNRRLESLVDKLDLAAHRERAEEFKKPMLKGDRRYDLEIVDMFRGRGFISFDELLGLLKVPAQELETLKGINSQIEALEGYGILEKEATGWRWRG